MTGIFVSLRLLAALASFLVTGNVVLSLLDRAGYFADRSQRFVLSFGLGIGVLAFLQLYVLWMRMHVTGVTLFFLIAPFWIIFLTQRARGVRSRRVGDFLVKARAARLSFSILEWCMIAFLGWTCFMMLATSLALPKYTWDARAVWGFIAKIIYFEGTIFTPDYLDPFRYHPAPSYPMLVPLTENVVYHVLGRFDEYLVKSLYAMFYVCWMVLLYHAQRFDFRCSRVAALAGLCVAAAVPAYLLVYCGSVPSAFVDFPLSFLYTFVIVYLLRYFRTHRRLDGLVSSLFLGFCLFTKQDGIPLYLLAVGVFVLEMFLSDRFRETSCCMDLLVYAGLPLLMTLPWFLVRASIPVHVGWTSPFMRSLLNLGKQSYLIPKIMLLSLKHMYTNMASWSLFWYLVTAGIFLFPRNGLDRAQMRSLAYLVILPFAYYIFCVTPVYMSLSLSHVHYPVEVEFEGASFERIRMHVLPLLVIYLGVVADRLLCRNEPA